ncbi:hypothetical protein QR685DRAFT_576681 [Neurospora intermedia]|uniref:Secreted protein n=1 Tax=Neurospora intermedia TaxID=5142 RepID=A0ABR3DQS7_NEUIN
MIPLLLACWICWLSRSLLSFFPTREVLNGSLQCLVRGDRRKDRFLGHIRVLYPVFLRWQNVFLCAWVWLRLFFPGFFMTPFLFTFRIQIFLGFVRSARTCLDNAPCSGLGYALLKLDYPLRRRFSFYLASLPCFRNLVLYLTIDVRVFFGPCSAPSSSCLPG